MAAKKKSKHDQASREWHAGQRLAVQDIGKVPRIADRVRRRDCLADFASFCRVYHSNEFSKPWAPYHKSTADRIQACVEGGGWYARALPRGGGKTTLCTCGVEWAALRGSHLYPELFAASDELAIKLLRGIKVQLATNSLLLKDYPHAIYPIRKLGNEARRAVGQKYKGGSTYIEWGVGRIVLTWIPEDDSLSSGVVIEAAGITGAIRGAKYFTRWPNHPPDIALVDDPQTRSSAKSPSQTQTRLEILTGDIAYLAGPGEPMPVFCPITVIYQDDLADEILDRDKHSEWQGERTRMVESFPTNMDLWDQYAGMLRASQREDGYQLCRKFEN